MVSVWGSTDQGMRSTSKTRTPVAYADHAGARPGLARGLRRHGRGQGGQHRQQAMAVETFMHAFLADLRGRT